MRSNRWRGPYGGVVVPDFSGNIDTAITIAMLVGNGHASIQAGAGVVADSVAADEHLECQTRQRRCWPQCRCPSNDQSPSGGHIMSRDTIRVEGPDTATYLQGQISQDVDAIGVGETAWSLVLQPNGKLASWFRIHRVAEQEFLLDTDEGHGSGLVARLERFKLRTDATIDVSDTQPRPR